MAAGGWCPHQLPGVHRVGLGRDEGLALQAPPGVGGSEQQGRGAGLQEVMSSPSSWGATVLALDMVRVRSVHTPPGVGGDEH